MATRIRVQNNSNLRNHLQMVSYGGELLVKYKAGSTLDVRNKMGAIFKIGNVEIGNIQIDADDLTATYKIRFGDLIKRHIEPLMPPLMDMGTGRSGVMGGYNVIVSVEPYITQFDIHGVSTTYHDVADDFNFTAVRGIDQRYYTKNISSASINAYSNYGHDIHRDGAGTITVPKGTYRVMYTKLASSDSTRTAKVIVKTQRYTTNASGAYVPYGSLKTKTHTNADKYDPQLVYIGVGEYDSHSQITKRTTQITTQVITTATGVVDSEEVYDLTAIFSCSNPSDFEFTLMYLNHDATWRAIPFLMNNEVSMDRKVFTMEQYDGKKEDYYSEVRKTITAKSDYMPSKELIYDTLYGLGNKFYMTRPIGTPIEVRLLSMKIPHKSGRDTPMSQIDVSLEVSDRILTP